MKIFVTSAYPFHESHNFAVQWLKNLAASSKNKKHDIVDNPEEADIILFFEHHPSNDPYLFKVIYHKYSKAYRKKVILYNDIDKPLAIVPTLSPSFEKKHFNKGLCAVAPFQVRHVKNESITYTVLPDDRAYLFSFLGSCISSSIRYKVLEIEYKECLLKDTSDTIYWKLSPEEKMKLTNESVEVYKNSYFVLCPAGVGPDSYRTYEVMEMGLAPVIISDSWIPMEGPDWDDFSIQVKEADVLKIPEILEANKHRAIKMGHLARKNWESWYSDDALFNTFTNCAEKLYHNKSNNRFKNFIYSASQFLRPFHFRNLLRFIFKHKLLKKLKS